MEKKTKKLQIILNNNFSQFENFLSFQNSKVLDNFSQYPSTADSLSVENLIFCQLKTLKAQKIFERAQLCSWAYLENYEIDQISN